MTTPNQTTEDVLEALATRIESVSEPAIADVRCTEDVLNAFGITGTCPRTGAGVLDAFKAAGFSVTPDSWFLDQWPAKVTVRQFVKAHPEGSYYFFTSGHALALVDGRLTDTEARGPDGRIVRGAVKLASPAPSASSGTTTADHPSHKAPPEALTDALLQGRQDIWDRILAHLGVLPGTSVKYLGGGQHGAAFLIGDRVLKLTDDKVEATAALILKDRPMDEAYKVYDAFRCRDLEWIYVLWLEVLEPATGPYASLVELWDLSGKAMDVEGIAEFAKTYPKTLPPEPLAWLVRCGKGLVERGIINKDLHGGNIMRRPGTDEHVVIDIGQNSTAPAKQFTEATTGEQDQPKDIWEALEWAADGFLREDELQALVEQLEGFPNLSVRYIEKTYQDHYVVDHGGRRMIVEFDGADSFTVTAPEIWMGGHDASAIIEDIGAQIEERFDAEFKEYPAVLYHATNSENLDSIMAEGLRADSRTRGLTNRSVGAAIFTTSDLEAVSDSYGDATLKIDVPAMKAAGVQFSVAMEPSVLEAEAAGVLANALGLDSYEHSVESDGADDPNTVILMVDVVPPQFLRVVSGSDAEEIEEASGTFADLLAAADAERASQIVMAGNVPLAQANDLIGKDVEVHREETVLIITVTKVENPGGYKPEEVKDRPIGFGFAVTGKVKALVSVNKLAVDNDFDWCFVDGIPTWHHPVLGDKISENGDRVIYPPTSPGRPPSEVLADALQDAEERGQYRVAAVMRAGLVAAQQTERTFASPARTALYEALKDLAEHAAEEIEKEFKASPPTVDEIMRNVDMYELTEMVSTPASNCLNKLVRRWPEFNKHTQVALDLLRPYLSVDLRMKWNTLNNDTLYVDELNVERYSVDLTRAKLPDGRVVKDLINAATEGLPEGLPEPWDVFDDIQSMLDDDGLLVDTNIDGTSVHFTSKKRPVLHGDEVFKQAALSNEIVDIANRYDEVTPAARKEMGRLFGSTHVEKKYDQDLQKMRKSRERWEYTEVTIEGLLFNLQAIDPQDEFDKDFLERLKLAVSLFKKACAKHAPDLLKHMPKVLRVEFQHEHKFTEKDGREHSAAGTYHHTNQMVCLYVNRNRNAAARPLDIAHTFAHECGHHWYRQFINSDVKQLWDTAFNKHKMQGEVSLLEIAKRWKLNPRLEAGLIGHLFPDDVLMMLRLQSLQYEQTNPGYIESYDDLIKRMEQGETVVKAPLIPVTGYGSKNAEEHFCEAIGLWLSFGERTVHPWYGMMLEIVFDEKFKAKAEVTAEQTRVKYTVKPGPNTEITVTANRVLAQGFIQIGSLIATKLDDGEIIRSRRDDLKYAHKAYKAETSQLYAIISVERSEKYRGQSIGYGMYEAFIAWVSKNGGGILVPDEYRHGGQSSEAAMKVWDKLKEKYESVGHMLIIGKHIPMEAVTAEEVPQQTRVPENAMRPNLLKGDVEAWERILAKLGVPAGTRVDDLGRGGHGAAFHIGDNVLKITDDPIEANAANVIRQNPMKEAYTVHAVYQIKGHDNVFAIWCEYLDEPDRPFTKLGVWYKRLSAYYKDTSPAVVKEFIENNRGEFEPEVLEWLQRVSENLAARGITHGDLHYGNIMRRPSTGEHVVIDIGAHSKAPDQQLTEASSLPAFLADDKFLGSVRNVKAPELWKALCIKLGVDPLATLEKLGKGTRGSVYGLPDGRAVKITQDREEAIACAAIRDRPDPAGHVYRIYAVYNLTTKGVSGPWDAYAIVMERLQLADPEFAKLADLWQAHDSVLPGNVEDFLSWEEENEPDHANHPMWAEFSQWLRAVAKYFKSVRIEFDDLWDVNVMRRGSEHVVIDIGFARAPGRVMDVIDGTITATFDACIDVDDQQTTEAHMALSPKSLDRLADILASSGDATAAIELAKRASELLFKKAPSLVRNECHHTANMIGWILSQFNVETEVVSGWNDVREEHSWLRVQGVAFDPTLHAQDIGHDLDAYEEEPVEDRENQFAVYHMLGGDWEIGGQEEKICKLIVKALSKAAKSSSAVLSSDELETQRKLDAYMHEYEQMSAENPLGGDRVWFMQDYKNGIIMTDVSTFDGMVHLGGIVSPDKRNTGRASKVLKALVDLADKHGVVMHLVAEPFGRLPGALDESQLQQWYARYGFVEDEDTGGMLRQPNIALAAAEAMEVAADVILAKLAATAFPALEASWAQWSPEAIKAFHETLVVWHKGTGYMHKEDSALIHQTPLDTFAQKFPAEWQAYSRIVAAATPQIPLFRSVMFDQAEDIVQEIIDGGDENLLGDLWSGLDWQNQLHLSSKPVTDESMTEYNFAIDVRRFSSWTSRAYAAYKLTLEGGMYQIGNGAVIVKAAEPPRVVHTFDAAVAFENWCAKNPEKAHGLSRFMGEWKWQLEYVVESETGIIQCSGLAICGQEGASDDDSQGFYERIKKASGYIDEDDYEDD